MLTTPLVQIILGNWRYESHVFAAQISRALLPATNNARLMFPAVVDIEAKPGEAAELLLGSGDSFETVLTGTVTSIERHPKHTLVVLSDGSYLLNQYRPGSTFERQNGSSIAEALAAAVQLAVGNISIDLSVPQFAAHQKRTAAEHIARLAELSDGYAYVDGAGRLNVQAWSDGPADAAIKYGRDLFDYSFAKQPNRSAIAPVGNGPSGSADSPDVLRPGAGSLPESLPDPGADNIWQAQPMLRTPAAVQTAHNGINRIRSQNSGQARLVGLLRADFYPGIKLEIQDVPAVSGNWIVTRLTHDIVHASYARTTMRAREEVAADSLFGALAGALGGVF